MAPIHDSDIKRILFITAHPDDLDFGAGGTIAHWTDKGIEVSYCVCTNGDQGGVDPDVNRSDMPKIRQKEQRDAGAVLGVSDIHFLNYVDGHLIVSHDVRKKLVRVMRQTRPDRLVIQSPERNWDRIPASHPDHMAAGENAMQAVYPDAGNPFAFTDLLEKEGLEPWQPREIWVMSHNSPNHVVDITDTIDRKIRAIEAHVSQVSHNPDLGKRIRDWGSHNAETHGLGSDRFAEVFRVVSL